MQTAVALINLLYTAITEQLHITGSTIGLLVLQQHNTVFHF